MITNHIQICFVYKKNTKCFLWFPFFFIKHSIPLTQKQYDSTNSK